MHRVIFIEDKKPKGIFTDLWTRSKELDPGRSYDSLAMEYITVEKIIENDSIGSRRTEKGGGHLAEGLIKNIGALIDEKRRYMAC